MTDTPNILGRMYGAIDTRQDGATLPVSSEAGFRRALTILKKKGKPATILITAPFTVKATFTLDLEGLTVTSSGKHAITPLAVVDPLFHVTVPNVTVENIRVPLTSPATEQVITFVKDSAANATGSGRAAFIWRNDVASVKFYEQTTTGVGAPTIIGNRVRASGAASGSAIKILGASGAVIGNRVNGDPTALEIALGNAGQIMVAGNVFQGAVDTTTSGGLNRFAANSFSATPTLYATDINADAREAVALKSATTSVNVSSATAPAVGQVLTATSDTAATWQAVTGSWTIVTATTAQTRSGSSALENDTALLFAMLASTKYRFRLHAMFINGNASVGFKYDLTGPATPTRMSASIAHAVHGAAGAWQVSASSYATTAIAAPVGSTLTGFVTIEGVIENGANAGNLQFRWAPNLIDAGATTRLIGSYIEYAVVA